MRSLPCDKITGKTGYTYKQSGFMSLCPNYDGDFFPKPLDELRKDASKRILMTGIVGNEGLLFGKSEIIILIFMVYFKFFQHSTAIRHTKITRIF